MVMLTHCSCGGTQIIVRNHYNCNCLDLWPEYWTDVRSGIQVEVSCKSDHFHLSDLTIGLIALRGGVTVLILVTCLCLCFIRKCKQRQASWYSNNQNSFSEDNPVYTASAPPGVNVDGDDQFACDFGPPSFSTVIGPNNHQSYDSYPPMDNPPTYEEATRRS